MKFDIMTIGGAYETIEAESAADAMGVFSFAFDTDLNKYFRAVPVAEPVPAPADLRVMGAELTPDRKTVLVVGARMCSAYGRYMARAFGRDLASAGVQVLSDGSLGVGGYALRGALDAMDKLGADFPAAFAVLPCGCDVSYPPENEDTFRRLRQGEGGIYSAEEDGTQATRAKYDKRREIAVSLADAVLIIEARKKSGVMDYARIAQEQGKPLFAVPGRVTDRLSDGTNDLLRHGALLAMSAEDIVQGAI